MPAPSPRTNPPRCASKGLLARAGFSLAVDNAVRAVKACDTERIGSCCEPPRTADHDVGIAAAEDFGGLADGLGAGSAGGEAIERGPARSREQGEMRERHIGLLLELAHDVHALERHVGPFHGVKRQAVSVFHADRAAGRS